MIAHEIRLAGDTGRLVGWLDLDEDQRHLAAIIFPFLPEDGCGFSQLRLPFVTVGPNRFLIVDPENLPILRNFRCFRALGAIK